MKKPERSYWLSAAAAVLVLVAFGIKMSALFNNIKVTQQIAAKHPADLKPGGNKAVLTLADGSKIVLDDSKHGKIARQQSIADPVQTQLLAYQLRWSLVFLLVALSVAPVA